MKRVLYFFPLNPADKNTGSCSRARGILHYLKARGFYVDFVSKQQWGNWTNDSKNKFNEQGLADNLYVFRRKPLKGNPISYFFGYKIRHLAFENGLNVVKGSIPNHTTLYLQQQFNALFQQNNYDYVIISYAYWADIVKNNPFLKNTITIIDTHDLLAAQHQADMNFDRGAAVADELRRLSLFDQVWAISPEETYFFGQFFKERVKYIPVSIEEPEQRMPVGKTIDLLYVATDNPHNLLGSAWFFEQVYPLLPPAIQITVIGTIVPHIPKGLVNVSTIDFVDDLNAVYRDAKIAVCPMLSGTGVKVKVVEALANGLPVVCNERGLDGLPNKTNNGCLMSNDPVKFAKNVMLLLTDEGLYRRQCTLGREMFEENFSKQSVYKRLDEAFGIK